MANEAIRDRLQRALRDALRARDKVAASALRSALAALDNASAVPSGPGPAPASGPHFAGARAGLGAGEVPRRGLADGEAERLVRAEIAEREAAAAGYENAGHGEQARRLRQEAGILASVLGPGAERLARVRGTVSPRARNHGPGRAEALVPRDDGR